VRENGPGSPITIDLNTLWTRKVQTIEQTPGLSVWRGDEKFSDIEGYVNLKEYGMSIINGKRRPHCVVFIEEGNKTLGTNSDSSGVSQGYIQQMLTYMENTKAHGIILLGPPGTSKSHFSKSMGNEAGCPTIALDMGGMKNSLVGESERRLRQALKVISAVGQGEVFFILSCNSIATLDPALLRRFKKGIFFLDLPTAEESKKIWDLYLKKYNIPKQKMPPSANWSGAEIKTCCDMADELGIPLVKAAQYIVPVAISARKEIDALRAEANNNFISASHDGVYTREEKKVTVTAPPRNLSGLN
jgi:SpoVK/Ycf46/Vps4 family AAA+-type ATPase